MPNATCCSLTLISLHTEILVKNDIKFQRATVLPNYSQLKFTESFGKCMNCNRIVCLSLDSVPLKNKLSNEICMYVASYMLKSSSEDDIFKFDDEMDQECCALNSTDVNMQAESDDIDFQSSEPLDLTSKSLPVPVPTFGNRISIGTIGEEFKPPHIVAQTWREQRSLLGSRPMEREPSVI